MIELTLPWPPSVNSYKNVGRLTRTKTGKIYQQRVNSPETKLFYWQVAMKIRAMKANEGLKSFSSEAILSLEMDVYPPDAKRRDIDNLGKCCLDSMQRGGLYPDDYQVARLLITRKEIFPEGKLVVRIYALESVFKG